MTKYLVRQYYPNYYTGFECKVYRDIEYDKITDVPFCKELKGGPNFLRLSITPYHGERIIEVHYQDGSHYVVGFALPMDSNMMSNNNDLMRDNWRYKDHIS